MINSSKPCFMTSQGTEMTLQAVTEVAPIIWNVAQITQSESMWRPEILKHLEKHTHMEKNRVNFRTHWVAIVCLLNLLVMQFWPTLQLEPPKGLGVKLSCQMPLSKGICFSLSSGCCIDHVSFLSIFRRCFFGGPGPPKMASLALEKIASIARWSTWLPCKDKATCSTWSRPGHLGMGPQRRSNAF